MSYLTEIISALAAARPKWFSGNGVEHVQAHAADRLPSETNRIIDSLDAVQPEVFGGNEVERLKVRAAARRLLARVETPYERAWGFCFEQPVVFAALQTCIDLGLWKSWTKVGGEKSINELVAFTTPAVDTNLLRRLFRLLAAFNVVEETVEDRFKPTPFSNAIGDESTKVRASLQAATNQYLAAGHNLPTYLAKISYKEPTEVNTNNHSDSDPDGLNFFGRLQRSPACYEAFNGHMEAWTAWKTPWTKVYDTTKLLEGAKLDDGSPFVVDVGGSTGIDISHVLAKHPGLPSGSLVLQDLPEVIGKATVDDKITAMVHDFFLPQPVKGSRAYFMHAVLHDWPDDKAKQLLVNTKNAMVKGYSKLFIYDIVLPPTGASISQATMDVEMMSLLSASERTQGAWTKLLTDAGLQIVNFWPDPQQYEMVIEAEVA
ncbi:Winged helix-turn-helix transcription repressor DNA-binding [Penicillium concentricum]|uniref:Winged helix-turn-helix transcription repressor DNA-binding n=1 Tax=Penicillium concentricum TaxID=293559 RepID=A0A9W9RIG4_9EURO|nr:Winged helix-turn-helix transcription repressor DNA-binding [Penicillium concentricum]KAJ5360888.1 Winged helix-turn-helix transcription repressor DNA-binding [Penicillium concentricum]